jgi:hypothetical protein
MTIAMLLENTVTAAEQTLIKNRIPTADATR